MRSRRRGGDAGAILVEAAVVTPLVMVLFLSVTWGALYMRSFLSVDHATKVGARTGSIASSSPDADFQILAQVKNNVTALGSKAVKKVIVYRADTLDAAPPPQCLTVKKSTTDCNIYSASDMNLTATQFAAPTYKKNKGFPSSARSSSRSGPPVYLGVYVESKSGATGFGLPALVTITKYRVLRAESTSY